jgi:ABC-2 type transport system ATP-binding protein
MSEAVVVAEGLGKRFGDFVAVDDVTFQVEAGEILGYLGPNGSGKTTTLRMLLGLIQPTSGRSLLFGQPMPESGESVRPRVGYMSQRFALYDELTVEENLAFYALAYGVRDPNRIALMLENMDLAALAGTRAGDLPIGWRQRLALASALLHEPRLLILDEPTSGVDPISRRSFWDRIYALASDGVAALVTTHYLDEAEFCHRIGIMIDGRLRALDSADRLRRSVLPEGAVDLWAEPLLEALSEAETAPGVFRAGLAGDHLRVILRAGALEADLRAALEGKGLRGVRTERVDPSLEDVFLALAGA